MAVTTVSDFVIWTKHIHDDPQLVARIEAMKAGETVSLVADGLVGTWRKMDDGRDGRRTSGIRPIGDAKKAWTALYQTRRGDTVALMLAREPGGLELGGLSEEGARFDPGDRIIRTTASEEERAAAIAMLLASSEKGWRSDGKPMSRDEMHER